MNFNQCFQCQNELPFTVSASSIRCPMCGALNEAQPNKGSESAPKNKYSMDESSSCDTSIIGASDFSSNCDSGFSGGGDC